jgi:hypothetical protein
MRTAITEPFKARTESGQIIQIVKVLEYIDTSTLNFPQETAGITSYDLVGGGHAKLLSDGRFKIVATGEIATRI